MPVDWSRYPSNWQEIAQAVKERAGWKCERCGVAHGVYRVWLGGKWVDMTGHPLPEGVRATKVIMTTAHVGPNKHDKMDCSNLLCLCQRCHLIEDMPEHQENARRTRERKKRKTFDQAAAGSLLEIQP